jgi:hypothetical protein
MVSRRDTDFDNQGRTPTSTIDCKLMNEVQISHLGVAIIAVTVTLA